MVKRLSKKIKLEEVMPEIYQELDEMQQKLEDHYKDMQDLEFTIENGLLTQTMKLKRNVISQHFAKEIENMYEGH